MRTLSILGAAVVLVSAAALPSMAQANCAQYDPGCQYYPEMKQTNNATSTNAANATKSNPANARAEARGPESVTIYQRHPRHRSAVRTRRMEPREAMNNGYYYGPNYRPGGPVGAAGAIAAGAVNTAGAIATAPFRAADSYAYYNGPNYAERCVPGTYFRGPDGYRHLCR